MDSNMNTQGNMDIALLILIQTLKEFPEIKKGSMWMATIKEIANMRGVSPNSLIRSFSDWTQGLYVIQSK